jgi:hypothetical protein
MRGRLQVVAELIADKRTKLEKLLDLYLSGEYPKEMLLDRKARLEKTILALERESTALRAVLEKNLLTTEQVRTMQEFAAKVRERLEVMVTTLMPSAR